MNKYAKYLLPMVLVGLTSLPVAARSRTRVPNQDALRHASVLLSDIVASIDELISEAQGGYPGDDNNVPPYESPRFEENDVPAIYGLQKLSSLAQDLGVVVDDAAAGVGTVGAACGMAFSMRQDVEQVKVAANLPRVGVITPFKVQSKIGNKVNAVISTLGCF